MLPVPPTSRQDLRGCHRSRDQKLQGRLSPCPCSSCPPSPTLCLLPRCLLCSGNHQCSDWGGQKNSPAGSWRCRRGAHPLTALTFYSVDHGGFHIYLFEGFFAIVIFFFFFKSLPKLGSSGQYSYEWSNRWRIFIVSVSAGGTKDRREVEIQRDGGAKKKPNWNVTCSRTGVDAQV